ncbi:MAG: UDP-N-acetylglucosamine 2-epimerase [Brevefilum sp.]|nr:UDP-N-acetylglucosamine 2-epimerase [Brevefilum sp.]
MKIEKPIYIIIGTRAQFIKVAPLMRMMIDQGVDYQLIYTAQHQENIDEILETFRLPQPDTLMYRHGEAKTKASFARWFIVTLFQVLFSYRKYLPEPGFVLTHGDTFTTWMAALMGKLAKCQVCHIESGLRSFNILSPFPEEISRLITFKLADIYFCEDENAVKNLKNFKGKKINVKENTMLDGVRFALAQNQRTQFRFQESPFALVSLHRYENIFTSRFTDVILPLLNEIAVDHKLVFTLHPTTRERLIALEIYEELDQHPKIVLHERFGFVDWINVCQQSEFVITDGGSNQEELYFMGVPAMLFRNETERVEELGDTIVLTKFDKDIIKNFLENYPDLRKDKRLPDFSPSQMIIDTLTAIGVKN